MIFLSIIFFWNTDRIHNINLIWIGNLVQIRQSGYSRPESPGYLAESVTRKDDIGNIVSGERRKFTGEILRFGFCCLTIHFSLNFFNVRTLFAHKNSPFLNKQHPVRQKSV